MCGKGIYFWVVVISVLIVSNAFAQEKGFVSIFDGKTLNGWKSSDMNYWSVTDGAITGKTTAAKPLRSNQFLVWQWGQLDDFELKLKYRIQGTDGANSGIQFRSRVLKGGPVAGYQADIDRGGNWTGALYDERGRGILCARGDKITLAEKKENVVRTAVADKKELWTHVDKDGWNDYHIIARGSHLVLKINGHVMSEITDNQKGHLDLSGVLALQLHTGPPMTIQFKDIYLKRLKMCPRKKIIMLAGTRSHGYAAHEHYAASVLMADMMIKALPNIHAVVYKNGWPKDPTAFDNADAVMVFCNGGGGHMFMPHLEQIDKIMKQGVGLAAIHYAVEVPKGKPGNYMLDWIGGYFETHWSVNPFWCAEFKKIPQHPITRGVKPFTINDEWYYHMRFQPDMKNVTALLSAIPPDSTRKRKFGPHSGNPHVHARMGKPEILAWAYERPRGGRGFGFTGGHFHANWAHDEYRKFLLNALVWITGAEVPLEGVASDTPTIEQLEANQDYPGNKVKGRKQMRDVIAGFER